MKNFLKSSSILMIGDLLTKMLSVLYLIPLLRFDPLIGRLNANLLIPFGFLIIFGTLGINIILSNEVAKYEGNKNETKKVLLTSFIILSFTTIIATLIMIFATDFIVALSIDSSSQYFNILVSGTKVMAMGIVLFSITTFLRAIVVGKGNYGIASMTYISEQIIKIVLILIGTYYILFKGGEPVEYYVLILAYSVIISMFSTFLIFMIFFFKKGYHRMFIDGEFYFDSKLTKHLIVTSLVIFSAGIFTTLFDQIDLFMMKNNFINLGLDEQSITNIQSEYFSSSLKLIMIPVTTASAFISVMMKHLNTKGIDKRVEFNKILNLALLYGSLVVVGFYFVGPIAHEFMYGYSSTIIFQMQALMIPFYIFRNLIGSYISTNDGKKKSILNSTIYMVITKVIFNIILFPIFGVSGYSIASIIAISVSIITLASENKSIFVLNKQSILLKLDIVTRTIILFGIISFLAYLNIFGSLSLIATLLLSTVIIILLYYIIFKRKIKENIK